MSSPTTVSEKRTCKGCKGTGSWSIGSVGPYPCRSCDEKGFLLAPDVTQILEEIKGRKGLCSKRPKSPRAYYVWRMARFHGGADVTMPVCAMSDVRHDPFIDELDKLADAVAKRVFGTHLAAASRWGRALGMIDSSASIPGLPPTAFESGPVLNGVEKPEEELLELH